jgi:pimeloyl-ACP methyl ester carboxylesterase
MNFIVQGYPAFAYTGGRPFDAKLPTIVFVHGAAFDHSVWQWQSRYFAHHGFGVLAVDLPGHGRSPGAARASVADYAEWLVALLDAAGIARAHLVGHSMGSLVTLEAALRHPQRVLKLALVGAAAPMPVGDAFMAAARADSPVGFEMETLWGHARLAQLAASPVPGVTLVGASLQLNARARAGVQHADLEACNGYSVSREKLAALKVPTLVVAGKRDQMTGFKPGQAIAAQIPGAKLVALDAGHSMMSEAPRELLRALREFLP